MLNLLRQPERDDSSHPTLSARSRPTRRPCFCHGENTPFHRLQTRLADADTTLDEQRKEILKAERNVTEYRRVRLLGHTVKMLEALQREQGEAPSLSLQILRLSADSRAGQWRAAPDEAPQALSIRTVEFAKDVLKCGGLNLAQTLARLLFKPLKHQRNEAT